MNEFIDGYLGGTFNGKEVLVLVGAIVLYFFLRRDKNAR